MNKRMPFIGSRPAIFALMLGWIVSIAAQAGDTFYIVREFTPNPAMGSKSVNPAGDVNGSRMWLWGPIPKGHAPRYRFKVVSAGDEGGKHYDYLLNIFTGKYMCSGDTKNGGKLWLSGPIPKGDEARYKFRLIETQEKGIYNIWHKFSGKYVAAPANEKNGSELELWEFGKRAGIVFDFRFLENEPKPAQRIDPG